GAGKALPIKLRIQADIQQRVPGVFSRRSLSLFLHRHTTSTPYIKALLASALRFDLDGKPAGEIAPEHREAAQVELDRRRALTEARRDAGREAARQAQRQPAGSTPAPEPGAEGRPAARPPRPPRREPPRRRPEGAPEGRTPRRP